MLRLSGSTSWLLLVVVLLSNKLISISGLISAGVNWGNSSSLFLLAFLYVSVLFVSYFLFCFLVSSCLFFVKFQFKLSNKSLHVWSMMQLHVEDFLFYHLGYFQLVRCITLGFLHKSLTQCGFCLPKITLISLSLLTLTCFALVYRPLEVRLMLSVS